MAATENVRQIPQSHNSSAELIVPRHGVVTLFGYGIQVRVDRGHLLVQDGIGPHRRFARLPRVGHGLKRLVVIGPDGMVSLAALRWLADQDASFAVLERNGKVLAVTGPVRPSDAKLRRAQALAHSSGVALRIARELISQKLTAQERVARHRLLDSNTAASIAHFRADLPEADNIASIRLIESQAASAYWSAFRTLTINFPKNAMQRTPHHWCSFGARISPLTGSARLAANPANAILNYLYALLESEARLATAALGLDPGLGVLHVDASNRDSLALDILEPVRPQVDAYVLEWISRQPLRREWFFEQRDGNCRLMGSFAKQLSETSTTWARAVAPVAEWVAQAFRTPNGKAASQDEIVPTRLTQRRRSEGRGNQFVPISRPTPYPKNVCRGCGTTTQGGQHCRKCGREISRHELVQAAHIGRLAAQSLNAQQSRTQTRRRHAAQLKAWSSAGNAQIMSEDTYVTKIQPLLEKVTISMIRSACGVSESYAADIRAGRRRPHPRHWLALAHLARVVPMRAHEDLPEVSHIT
jgi:CRISPR-associated endonuclease Cas1